MSVTIIYGPLRSGKSEKCIEIAKNAKNDVYYIVPEPFSYNAEMETAKIFGAVSAELAEVTSFKRLYHKTAAAYGIGGYKRLTQSGKELLLGYVCKKVSGRLGVLKKSCAYPGFAQVMGTLTKEFSTYEILPEQLKEAAEKTEDDALSHKLSDIYEIYSEFAKLTGEKYIFGDDELTILHKLIADHKDDFADTTFIFDGFNGFTPQEMQVISNLHDSGSDIYITFAADLKSSGVYADQNEYIKEIEENLGAKYIKTERNYSEPDFLCIADYFEKNIKTKATAENIYMAEYNTIYDEVSAVAENITKYVKSGGRFKDISVCARDSGRYLNIISEIFRQYEIPCFISKKINAATQPAADLIFNALDAVVENFSYKSVFSYLKSGLVADIKDEVDLLENYCVAVGIKGSSYKKEWTYTPKIANDFESDEEFLKEINRIRVKLLTPLINLSDDLKSQKTVREKAESLFKFMTGIRLFENTKAGVERFKASDMQIAAYYGQIWNIIIDSMDEAVELLGDEEVAVTEFAQIIKSSVSAHEIGIIPTTLDSVTVCSPIEAMQNKILFALGVNDGVYPQVMTDEGILNDTDRAELKKIGIKIAPDTMHRVFSEEFLIYNLLMRAKEKLFISYPITDISGATYRPSRIIKRLTDFFDNLSVTSYVVKKSPAKENIVAKKPAFSFTAQALRDEAAGEKIDKIWHETAAYFKETEPQKYNLLINAMNYTPKGGGISKEVMDRFLGEKGLSISVSRLESYKKCPFAHFINYMLELKKRKTATLEVTDTGTFMHDIMQELSNTLTINGLTWKSADDDFIKSTAVKIIDAKIIETEKLFDSEQKRRAHLLMRLKNKLLLSVMYVAKHLKAGKFEPIGYEIDISGKDGKYIPLVIKTDGKSIRLRGVIDRADVYTDENGGRFIRIIDYKSGNRDFDIGKTMCGLSLQLAVYLDRMCELENASPAGMLYFKFSDPVIEEEDEETLQAKLDREFKMTGIVLNSPEIIEAMDENISGSSEIIPVSVNKDGSVSKISHVASFNQFMGLRKEINKIVKSISREILQGKTDISPIKYNKDSGCTYCDYKDICHFDKKLGCKYNYVNGDSKDEIMKRLEEGRDNA